MSATRHGELSAELADKLRELGDVRALHLRQQADAWGQTAHLPVTERREYTRHITVGYAADLVTLEQECEALRVELRAVEFAVDH